MRRLALFTGVLATLLAACGGGSAHHPTRARHQGITPPAAIGRAEEPTGIAYVIGDSTDPYGNPHLDGLGVATGVLHGSLKTVESRDRPGHILGNIASWLGPGRLLATDGEGGRGAPAAVVAWNGVQLKVVKQLNTSYTWSPDHRTIAFQPISAQNRIFVEHANGSAPHLVARGQLNGWSPAGQLVLSSNQGFVSLDLRTGARRALLSSRQLAARAHVPPQDAGMGDLAWSADGEYFATLASVAWSRSAQKRWRTRVGTIVVANKSGTITRLITSPYNISMFAWSPHGHQLAYTTSGFPIPHELYVLSSPRAEQRRILSQIEHFDWVTWSPDNRWLLIDNEHLHEWELLRLTGHRQARFIAGPSVPTRRLPRLGGEPLWCCPQDHYGGR